MLYNQASPSMINKLLAPFLILAAVAAGCDAASRPDGSSLVTQAQQAWAGDWHAVWQIEWGGAPVRGPLVAEIWHAGDGSTLRVVNVASPQTAECNSTRAGSPDSV